MGEYKDSLCSARRAFRPKPKVDSAVVQFDLLSKPKVAIRDEALYKKVVKSAFAQRRKKIVNSFLNSSLGLDKETIEEWLRCAGISAERRAETLTMEEFARLSNNLSTFLGLSTKK